VPESQREWLGVLFCLLYNWKPWYTAGIGKLLRGLFAEAPETGWLTETLTFALSCERGLGGFL
jgi:hypothetical protein